MLRIVTDGATDMPLGWVDEFEIEIIPLRIRFGEETYIQGVDVTNDSFYGLVNRKQQIPQTSLPSPYQIAEFFRGIAREGDTILSIHISSKLSGTFSAVLLAVEELGAELKVIPVDSLAGSAAVGFMCREAREMDRAGHSIEEILQRLDEIKRKVVVIFTLDNLEFARINGRVSALQSILSSMLKIKPIVVLKDGMLTIGDKVRTRQRSLEKVVEIVKERVGKHQIIMAVVHAADLPTAKALVEKAKQMLNVCEVIVTDLAIPVAANLGPGTVGIVAIPVEERG
jgi:DegV family protein with EDD domain